MCFINSGYKTTKEKNQKNHITYKNITIIRKLPPKPKRYSINPLAIAVVIITAVFAFLYPLGRIAYDMYIGKLALKEGFAKYPEYLKEGANLVSQNTWIFFVLGALTIFLYVFRKVTNQHKILMTRGIKEYAKIIDKKMTMRQVSKEPKVINSANLTRI